MVDENKSFKTKKRIIWAVAIVLLVIIVAWFSLAMYNYYRVKTDKKPLLCYGNTKEVEANNEYSYTCYGILYKYKEYYSTKNDKITAREYTLFFKDFDRK